MNSEASFNITLNTDRFNDHADTHKYTINSDEDFKTTTVNNNNDGNDVNHHAELPRSSSTPSVFYSHHNPPIEETTIISNIPVPIDEDEIIVTSIMQSRDIFGMLQIPLPDNANNDYDHAHIHKKWKKIMLKVHPDKNRHSDASSASSKLNTEYVIYKEDSNKYIHLLLAAKEEERQKKRSENYSRYGDTYDPNSVFSNNNNARKNSDTGSYFQDARKTAKGRNESASSFFNPPSKSDSDVKRQAFYGGSNTFSRKPEARKGFFSKGDKDPIKYSFVPGFIPK